MKRFHHETERAPCGELGQLRAIYGRRGGVDLSDCLVAQRTASSVTIWEPLPTKAPGPHLTRPWCCYIATVIFYRFPYLTMPPKPYRDREGNLHPGSVGSFFEWDKVEMRMTWDDLAELADGKTYQCGGGSVRWHRGRWWCVRWARAVVQRRES